MWCSSTSPGRCGSAPDAVFVQGPIFFQSTEPVCDGSAIGWESEVIAPLGLFKGGKATATVSAFACTENFDCAETTAEVEVALRGKPRPEPSPMRGGPHC